VLGSAARILPLDLGFDRGGSAAARLGRWLNWPRDSSDLLQEHDLKPWQEKMWCIAELDEQYIERMEDVLDVYERPY
jgi:hypothetical protein